MNLPQLVLGSAGLGVGAIGVAYLLATPFMLRFYGVAIQSVNHASLVRSSYGGMFLGFALLLLLGASNAAYEQAALLALLAFMGGFAVGRVASLVADGRPSFLVWVLFAFEVVYSVAPACLLAGG